MEPKRNQPSHTDDQPSRMAGPAARAVASLLIFIHLCCVLVVMAANLERSPLQARIVEKLRPYTQTLNFELVYVPFHLTHATDVDVDHRVEVLPRGKDPASGENWIVLPDVGIRGGDRYRRYQRLGSVLGFFGSLPGDETPSGLVAKGIAENFLHQAGVDPQRIRARRHALQSPDDVGAASPQQADPWDEEYYFRTPYEANLIVNDDGTVSVVKVDPEGEVARPVTPAGPAPPARNP